MRWFRNAPLRTKLILLLTSVVTIAQFLAAAVNMAVDVQSEKAAMAQHLGILANVLGSQSEAALTFELPKDAEEVLAFLKLEPTVVFACIHDAKGVVFATYKRQETSSFVAPIKSEEGHVFTADGHLETTTRIMQNNQRLGVLFLRASMNNLNAQIRDRLLMRGIVLISAVTVTIALAAYFQRIISRPVRQLADAAKTIAADGDYSVRVRKESNDELGVLSDGFNAMLTQIQKRDDELEQHHMHLEELVQERTRNLEAKTQELARSNTELELFASVASHDLQEPLRMVASYMELLGQRYQGKLDDKANRWIGFAVDGVVRMKQLINDLLEFSRVGTRGKAFAPTDCEVVLKHVLQNLQQAIKDTGASVTRGRLPTIPADDTQMAQVMQNLIANAIKFRGTQPPVVRVEAERNDEGWRFSVRDNGIGIDSQFAERIFVIFQRLHTREEYPGTGIGLAVVKKIIERHHGRIWVESQLGQGTTFFFTLPAAAQAK